MNKDISTLQKEVLKVKNLNPNNVDSAIDWDGFKLILTADLMEEIGDLAKEVAATVDSKLPKNEFTINWDIEVNTAITDYLNTHTAEMVREVTDSTKAAIRSVVQENYQNWIGTNVRTMARDLKPIVGLTEYQKSIVDNYREKLEAEKDSGIYRSQKQIDTMVENKAEAIRNYRCKLIANQESNLATRKGTLAAYGANGSIIGAQWFVTSSNPCEECIKHALWGDNKEELPTSLTPLEKTGFPERTANKYSDYLRNIGAIEKVQGRPCKPRWPLSRILRYIENEEGVS